MNRIDSRVKAVRERGEKGLFCLLPLGDPDLKTSRELVELYLRAGADLIELGLPSRAPYLDSIQIAQSNQRSFKAEPNLMVYFDAIRAIRQDYPYEPFEVMAYSDIVKEVGVARFVDELQRSDVDAHLLADATEIGPEIVQEMDPLLASHGIYRIRFMPHPFRESLLQDIGANARGAMILQSFANPGGQRAAVADANRALVERLRRTGTQAAILLAYGINNPVRAAEAVRQDPDGLLVGTAMVEGIASGKLDALAALIRSIKDATIPAPVSLP